MSFPGVFKISVFLDLKALKHAKIEIDFRIPVRRKIRGKPLPHLLFQFSIQLLA